MTYLELQNEVLSDRFSENKRVNVKRWLNYRYGRLWAAEDWTFKQGVVTYNVSTGASSIPLGTVKLPLALWDTTISPGYEGMEAVRPEIFYGDASRTSGVPEGFTVVGSNIILNKPVLSARTYQVFGELAFVPLSLDADTPLVPSEFHMMLVTGAVSEGLKQENDPSWSGAEADWDKAYEDLKRGYLVNVRTYGGSYPSWG